MPFNLLARSTTYLRASCRSGSLGVQVTCQTEKDPAMLDETSPLFDPDCDWKARTAQAIAAYNVGNPANRELAERFARSGINFSVGSLPPSHVERIL